MLRHLPALLADVPGWEPGPSTIVAAILAIVVLTVLVVIFLIYFKHLVPGYMSNANVSIWSLIGMSLRRVDSRIIVRGKIMAIQAGIGSEQETGVTTRRLEAHFLAGGSVPNVIQAIIAAHRADIDLDFDRAAAIDLAGRDVVDAVQTSVSPKVIDCPDPKRSGRTTLSAIAKNGVELKVRAGSPCGPTSSSSSAAPPRRRSSPAWAKASSLPSARRTATWR